MQAATPSSGGYPVAPMAQPFFDHQSVMVTCPNCKSQGPTRVWHMINVVCRSCQSAEHHCSTCNYKVGHKSFLLDDSHDQPVYVQHPTYAYGTAGAGAPPSPQIPPQRAKE